MTILYMVAMAACLMPVSYWLRAKRDQKMAWLEKLAKDTGAY